MSADFHARSAAETRAKKKRENQVAAGQLSLFAAEEVNQ